MRQRIAFRAKVVVDHVEDHGDAALVAGVDQRLEVVGRAVAVVRRELKHAVVAPAPRAGELRHRHQLNRRDAQFDQLIQKRDRGPIRSFRRVGADVQFVDQVVLERQARSSFPPCHR